MSHRLGIIALFFVLISACSTAKKITSSKSTSVEETLDTVEITVSRENPYRAAATKNFDLVHTKLEVKFDYPRQYLYGKATITLKPHFYPQRELVLDAKQFDIHEVSLVISDGARQALQYTYDSLQLKIQLDREYARDKTLKIYIDYTAKPNERKEGGSMAITDDKGLYFINPLGTDTLKPIQIWTQGETESNSCWFPTIDKPDQKCTDEIYITHDKKYVSLSNGALISCTPVSDNLVTDYWKMDLPHAPYLFMMAIGNFSIVHEHWRDIPVDYYVEKEYAPYAKQIFGNTPEMMEFFSQKLDFDYPWAKYAQVVVRDYVSGAMENTTATLHGEFLNRNPRELLDATYEEVISHELFHQWFGDLVTPVSWSNTPLNESFATYGEFLWNEYKYGRECADYKQLDDMRKYMEEAKAKNVDLIRFHYDDKEDMFDRHSYEKGGLVLNYLRHVVGDEAFFKSLQLYLKQNQFKWTEIHRLRQAFEEVSGRDMNWFFNEWFLNSGHPQLDIHYSYDNDSVYVTISQSHNTDVEITYQLPFKVGIWYGKNMLTYDEVLKKKSQTFAFKSNGTPELVDFDPEHAVLCERKDNKNWNNYIFEYHNAPYYAEKIEALKKLSEQQKQNAAAHQVMIDALSDGFYALREYALSKLELPKDGNDSLYTKIENIALKDERASVRKAAIELLGKSANASKFALLFQAQTADSSYQVAAASLRALDEIDSKKAMQSASKFENEKNPTIVGAVADVYSREGDADYQTYFENKLKKATGVSKYSMFFYYANFLARMDKNVVLKGIKTIEEQGGVSDSHFVAGAAKGALRRIVKSFDDRKKKLQEEMANQQSQTAKLELQQTINECDYIVGEANDALSRMNRKK